MEFREKLLNALRFGPPIHHIQTDDDRSLLDEILYAAVKVRELGEAKDVLAATDLFMWTFAKGAYSIDDSGNHTNAKMSFAEPGDLSALTTFIREKISTGSASLFILQDLDDILDDQPMGKHLFKDIGRMIESASKAAPVKSYVISTGRTSTLPSLLSREIPVLKYDLPGKKALRAVVDGMTVDFAFTEEEKDSAVGSLLGLTELEAQNALGESIALKKDLDTETLLDAKASAIADGGIVEYCKSNESMEDIGGLDGLKEWITQRQCAFTPAAREFGLPEPKGLLMTGIPGTGKSLSAKAIAKVMKVPLLRLDIGAVFGSLVGESEGNMRRALSTAEAMSPSVLHVDEIDKAFASNGGTNDGGTSARVFGSFLTWLQEKQKPVFVVATANDISNLPPELLRSGRLDGVFFVDLPNEAERTEIFGIHLKKKGRSLTKKDVASLVKATANFSGAEIEQVVTDGLYRAFADRVKSGDKKRDLTKKDVELAISETVPLSTTMKERIDALRKWAQTRARPASTPVQAKAARKKGRDIL